MLRRRVAPRCALVAGLALVAGCSSFSQDMWALHEGTLEAPSDPAPVAVSYDPALAPTGATLRLETVRGPESTTATLWVTGLLPDRGYAAHLHDERCGPDGDDAGPHFQHELDPAATPDSPSTDPAFANPDNEIWLDFGTDAAGNGMTSTTVPFALADDRAPQSLIVHEEEQTATGPDDAGTAGARVACLAVST